MLKKRIVIVGGGIAGLCACLKLSHHGYDVTLIERAEQVGGKIRTIQAGDLAIDSGPTVFTMRWVFEELFNECDENFSSLISTTPLPVLARHFWGTEQLDLYADQGLSAKAIQEFSGKKQADLFLEFCRVSKKVYESLESPYIRTRRPTLPSMMGQLGLSGTKTLMGIGPFKNLWQSLEKFFPDPRLQQLFARYATYCGSSPFLAPATLMLIAHVEMAGVWSIDEGMTKLPQTIAALAQARGAIIRNGTQVKRILLTKNDISGVELDSGEIISADAVIFNGDIMALTSGLLGSDLRDATPPMPTVPSLSAVTWSASVPSNQLPISHHNVFFDTDYASEFTGIFDAKKLPAKPTVYLCAQSRIHTEALNNASEKVLLLINAPATGDLPLSTSEIELCQEHVFQLLGKSGFHIPPESWQMVRTTPQDFHQLFPATKGALYGMATHGWMSSFQRPNSISTIKNLFLAGGSVHPGPGVPMAALSGRMAAATLMDHLPLTN
jgi:1-hydroxycarotenoid 3,4-desaturase